MKNSMAKITLLILLSAITYSNAMWPSLEQMPSYGIHVPLLKMLYAPWRQPHKPSKESSYCPFCNQFNDNNDERHFILKRYKHAMVMLNLYPYAAGHMLIIPYRHVQSLKELNPEELTELMILIQKTTSILMDKLQAEGINVGINIGKAAGASIPGHVHIHIVPRFLGDCGFLVSIAQTQVITNLMSTYQTLLPSFQLTS